MRSSKFGGRIQVSLVLAGVHTAVPAVRVNTENLRRERAVTCAYYFHVLEVIVLHLVGAEEGSGRLDYMIGFVPVQDV